MVADSRGRLNVLEYDHDLDEGEKTDDVEATATFGSSGMVSFAHVPADTEITIVADISSDMVILPDSRASMEIDAYGDQLDDFPDGKIVGAFGDGSGARPDVWICPLVASRPHGSQRQLFDLRLQVGGRDDLGVDQRPQEG